MYIIHVIYIYTNKYIVLLYIKRNNTVVKIHRNKLHNAILYFLKHNWKVYTHTHARAHTTNKLPRNRWWKYTNKMTNIYLCPSFHPWFFLFKYIPPLTVPSVIYRASLAVNFSISSCNGANSRLSIKLNSYVKMQKTQSIFLR